MNKNWKRESTRINGELFLAFSPGDTILDHAGEDDPIYYHIIYQGKDVGRIAFIKTKLELEFPEEGENDMIDAYAVIIDEIDLKEYNLERKGIGTKIVIGIHKLFRDMCTVNEFDNYLLYAAAIPANKGAEIFFKKLGYTKVNKQIPYDVKDMLDVIGDPDRFLILQLENKE